MKPLCLSHPFLRRAAWMTACLCLLTGLVGGAPDAPRTKADKPANDAQRWLEKLDKEDRAALDKSLGFPLPPVPKEATWVGTPLDWSALRGKVVVLQTWTSKTGAGRKWPERVKEMLKDVTSEDLVFVAVHTPEGADSAAEYLKQKPAPMPVLIDSSGAFLDELGAFKRPVNIVVDRNGEVRYAGLNAAGLPQAVQSLLAEVQDTGYKPRAREAGEKSDEKVVEFPTFQTPLQRIADFRGKPAPPMGRVKWLSAEPRTQGKLVVIDFWATTCGPCRAAVPHLSDLSDRFIDDVCIIGLTHETESKVTAGLKENNLEKSAFRYAVASDPSGIMSKAMKVEAIPQIVVISSDNIVRWQGSPNGLDAALLQQLVDANRALLRRQGGAAEQGGRWSREPKPRSTR